MRKAAGDGGLSLLCETRRVRLFLAAVASTVEVAAVEVVLIVVAVIAGMVAAAVVEQTEAAVAAATAGRPAAASDVVEAGLARQLAAGGAAARPGRSAAACAGVISGMGAAALMPHHGANAAKQKRAADHAGRSRRSGAEKRAALSHRRTSRISLLRTAGISLLWPARISLLRAAISLLRRISLSRLLRHACQRSGVPGRRHALRLRWVLRRLARSHRRHRAAAALQAVACVAEKAGIARRLACAFELADARVGALERFVLHQHGLHQRIGRIGGLAQAVPDQPFGIGIALGVLERGKPVEQLDDEIAFLWGHLAVSFLP